MTPHVFAYRRAAGVPPRLNIREPDVAFGLDRREKQYQLIEDDDVAAYLRDYEKHGTPAFRYVTATELEDVLATADDAIEAVESGEYDGALDLLLFAEREAFDNRVTVIDALAGRHRELVEQRQTEGNDGEGVLTPGDVAPGAGALD